MNALEVAARFTAYTWYKRTANTEGSEEASRFAQKNWEAFLPMAHEGLGRLLLRIARRRAQQRRRERISRHYLVTAQ